jgi:hypothetical protein
MVAREAMSVMMMDDLQVGSGVLAVKPEALMQRIHTPPQVDVSASKNRKTGNKRGTSVLSIFPGNTHISPSQQITANYLFPISPVYQLLIGIKSTLIIYLRNIVTIFPPKIQAFGRQYSQSNDIQTYSPPVDMSQENTYLMAAEDGRSEPAFEGGQKKDGKRPSPGKPDTSKIEKPGREGDKGSQRVKQPKKERPQQA